ncbi:MAG: hypothetical protein HFG73_10425 [Hungatella sp.]|nr:hypothetical protein [Hungatella sp.]
MDIRVNIKHMGKKKKPVEPRTYHLTGEPATVRELILAVAEAGAQEYNRRLKDKASQDLLKCLTRQEIEDKAETGKVSFGVVYGEKEADVKQAGENAVQCFEDGIYRIFLDDRPLEDLDEDISGQTDGMFTFVRLTMLSGRMW